MKEFQIIRNYLSKLVDPQLKLGLNDDASLYKLNTNVVQSADMLVEGVHFFKTDRPSAVARRAMISNISDIASMGALPKYYTLCISIPKKKNFDDNWFAEFSDELFRIQQEYNIYLIGGDTVCSDRLVVSINIMGQLFTDKVLTTSNACAGDSIYISNFVGDAYWAFKYYKRMHCPFNRILSKLCKNSLFYNKTDISNFHNAYYRPRAQVVLGQLLLNYANSCTDISDGLILDLEKICLQSKVRARIDLEKIIFSSTVAKIIRKSQNKSSCLVKSVTGGDDYQLVFSVSKDKEIHLLEDIHTQGIFVQKIGDIYSDCVHSYGVDVYHNGDILNIKYKGYEHN